MRFSKFSSAYFSGSVAIVADAINNLSDAASSVVTVFGFKLSNRPADREHPFGHARYRIHRGVYHCVCGRAYRRVAVEAEH
ncbi:MAG: cation transporter [Clostridiales bacterium]|nr:MAG: cation transporter [Clostridiales bacterium]